jgi:ubiquinone/menaquinone biosynthesis C-methylase UbiE
MHHIRTHEHAPQTRGRTIPWAHRYDMLTNLMLLGKELALREMMAEMAEIKPGDKVLDVGCGTGNLTLAAQARAGASGEVHGIDAAPEMIEVARSKAARSGANVDFQIGLIEQIPFPDGYFDVVLSSLMIHHLPDDLKRKGFVEMRRVLKPNGHLFAVDFEPPTSPWVRALLAHLLSHGMMRVDVREYVPMMEEAGFEQVEAGKTKFRYISFVRGSKS